ncbi:MAG TPA: AEC family transporter [Pseudogracilibacillus sp.]|nr:AEC family transporter [Pseudogracilibacillus sp.]
MDIAVVYHSIILIALLIILGAITAREYKLNNDTRQMYMTLIIKVAMPSIILSSIFKVDIDSNMFKILAMIFLISILINLLGLILGFIASSIFKLRTKRIEIVILSAFGNTGFIGIPLCAVLFGAEGALYAAIFDAGVDFTIWTFGVFIIQNNKSFNLQTLKGMINIPLIAIIMGLIVAALKIPIHQMIIDLSDSLAAFAVPLAMFYIGATMNQYKSFSKSISYFELVIPVVVKLILLPVLVVIIVFFTRLDELTSYVLIVQSMMPALTLSSILFAKHSRDENFGAFVTVISTIVSLLTIPALLFLIDFT